MVYPVQNKPEPSSIWSELFPRSEMRWEWTDDGDSRGSDLWHARALLSESREVVYAKWHQGRATFFSRDVFRLLLAYLRSDAPLSSESAAIFEALEQDSPLSTKKLKEASDLQGKLFEPVYERAMRALWRRLQIVGFGEIEDSSFPSLAVGATKLLFEDLWSEALALDSQKCGEKLESILSADSPFLKFARKIKDGGFK